MLFNVGLEKISRLQHKLILLGFLFVSLLLVAPCAEAAKEGESQVFQSKEAGLEFTIQLPPLWNAEPGTAGYAVVLKPSARAPRIKLPQGMIGDPTITIAAVKKGLEFDQENLEKMAQEIQEKFIKANGTGTQFQVFQKNLLQDLPDGRKGFLFYVSYTADGNDVGQAILVTGHQAARYRVTLSDHRLNFDKNLELYYPFMTSLTFPSPQPVAKRNVFQSNEFLLWGIGVVVGGTVVGLLARGRRPERRSSSSHRRRSYPVGDAPQSVMRSRSSGYSSRSSSSRHVGSRIDSEFARSAAENSRFDSVGHEKSSTQVEPVFNVTDLSTPPESVPLSQVVDENSAAPELKKRWRILSATKKGKIGHLLKKTFFGRN